MNFKKNFNRKSRSKGSLVSFFNETRTEDLNRIAAELSPEAKEFFDSNISSLLGNMPEIFAETTITINRNALYHLLYSSMVTGYMSKAVEHKFTLEKLWSGDGANQDSVLSDKHLPARPKLREDLDF